LSQLDGFNATGIIEPPASQELSCVVYYISDRVCNDDGGRSCPNRPIHGVVRLE
jgi:hypothetical protein